MVDWAVTLPFRDPLNPHWKLSDYYVISCLVLTGLALLAVRGKLEWRRLLIAYPVLTAVSVAVVSLVGAWMLRAPGGPATLLIAPLRGLLLGLMPLGGVLLLVLGRREGWVRLPEPEAPERQVQT